MGVLHGFWWLPMVVEALGGAGGGHEWLKESPKITGNSNTKFAQQGARADRG